MFNSTRIRTLLTAVSLATAAFPAAAAHGPQPEPSGTEISGMTLPMVHIEGICAQGLTIFIFKNSHQPWEGRGVLSVLDASSGEIISVRSLTMAAGQTATFQVPPHRNREQYRALAQFPDGSQASREFSGHCPAPR